MAAILAAAVIGILIGLFLRHFLDDYLRWKTAIFWRDHDGHADSASGPPVAVSEESDAE